MAKIFNDSLKYLGIDAFKCDEQTKNAINSAIEELLKAVNFKSCYKVFNVNVDGDTVNAGDITFTSKGLSTHLKNAKKVIIYSATLGSIIDKLINAYAKIDVFKQVVMQAVATAIIESEIDKEQENFKNIFNNYVIKSRFSPGYGDLSLEYQPLILNLLNAQKNCGIYANAQNVLTPSKSVTAIIGLF